MVARNVARNSSVAALARLHASDIEHNLSASGTAGTLLTVTASYLGVVAVLLTRQVNIPPWVAVFVPVPMALILMYHLVLVAGVMRRGQSAARLEDALFAAAGLPVDLRSHVGTVTSDEIFDLRLAFAPGRPWIRGLHRYLMAFIPYVGWYLVALGVTLYVLIDRDALGLPSPGSADGGWKFEVALWVARAVAATLWLVIVCGWFVYYVRNEDWDDGAAEQALPVVSPDVGGGRVSADQVEALSQLHWSDAQHNTSANSMAMALVGATVAYGAILATAYRPDTEVAPAVYMALALPPVMLIMYEVLVVSAVLRRSRSARLLEDELMSRVEVGSGRRWQMGTRASDSVMDASEVVRTRALHPVTWGVRFTTASLPYVGWSSFVLAFNLLVVVTGAQRFWTHGGRGVVIGFGAFYGVTWLMILLALGAYRQPGAASSSSTP